MVSLFLTESVFTEHSRINLYTQVLAKLRAEGVTWSIVSVGRYDLTIIRRDQVLAEVYSSVYSDNRIIRLWRVMKTLIRVNPGHLIIGGYGKIEYWLAWCYAVLSGKFITFYTGAGERSSIRKSAVVMAMKKLFVSRTDNFISYGTKAMDFLVILGAPKERVCKAINVSDTEFIKRESERYERTEELETDRGHTPGRKLIFCGRINQEKGILLLLDQLKAFDRSMYHLSILGKGPLESCINQAIIDGGIHGSFYGHVDRNEVVRHLTQADIFISPTLNDPFSRTMSEAICSGCFCLSSVYDDASYDLICSENGKMIDPLNHDDFRQNLAMVLDPNWKKPERWLIRRTLNYSISDYARCFYDSVLYFKNR